MVFVYGDHSGTWTRDEGAIGKAKAVVLSERYNQEDLAAMSVEKTWELEGGILSHDRPERRMLGLRSNVA